MIDQNKTIFDVGNKINGIRKEKKLSYRELGFIAEIDKSTMIQICKGTQNLTLKTIVRIANALEIEIKDIL